MKFNAENRLVRATDVRAHTRVTSDVNAFVSFLIIFFPSSRIGREKGQRGIIVAVQVIRGVSVWRGLKREPCQRKLNPVPHDGRPK